MRFFKKMFFVFVVMILNVFSVVAEQPFEIKVDFDVLSGHTVNTNRTKIFAEESVAPGDILNYDIKVNNKDCPSAVNFSIDNVKALNNTDISKCKFEFYHNGEKIAEGVGDNFRIIKPTVVLANTSEIYALRTTLDLDSITNKYQGLNFTMEFFFRIEEHIEIPSKFPKIYPLSKKTINDVEVRPNVFKTGQGILIFMILILLVICSLIGLMMYVKRSKKEKKYIEKIFFGAVFIFAVSVIFSIYNSSVKEKEFFIFGYKPYLIISGSMFPEIKTNSVVVVQKGEIKDAREGDIITFKNPNGGLDICHRVVKITENGLLTKGDNNKHNDEILVSKNQYLGKLVFKMNFISYIINFYKKYGFIKAVAIPISGMFLIITFFIIIISVNKKVKYARE